MRPRLHSNVDKRISVHAGISGTFITPETYQGSPGDPQAKAIVSEIRSRAEQASSGLCQVAEEKFIESIDTALEQGKIRVDEVDGKLAWKIGSES